MTKSKIKIIRTEQWEYTASITLENGKSYSATGSSETSAERNLLRKLVFGDSEHYPLNEFGHEIKN